MTAYREKDIEAYLRKRVKEHNGKAYKWVSPGNNGVPDRIVIVWGEVAFIEVKSPVGALTPLQKLRIKELTALGMKAGWVATKEDVDNFFINGSLRTP